MNEIKKSAIYTGDALDVLSRISDGYINCCITSPPYYGLRDYGAAGQIGLEESPEQYVKKMVKIFREVRRTLCLDGTLWLNLGDTYVSSGKNKGYKRKDLIGIPWLVVFALRADGWYLRQDIIWNKPNAMPESVKDRCTKSHEYIFLLSKSEKYYFNSAAIKEPAVGFNNSPPAGSIGTLTPNSRRRQGYVNAENTTGLRNRRSVWNVATQGNVAKAHFATFPEKLIEPCVLAGSRPGGIVLDPFVGSGTTAVVAAKHGREYIGIDLNAEYAEMARIRAAAAEGSTTNDNI